MRYASALYEHDSGLMGASAALLFMAIIATLLLPLYNVFADFDRKRKIKKAKAARRARKAALVAAAEAAAEAAKPPPPTEEEMEAATKITAVAKGRVSRRKLALEKEMRMKQKHAQAIKEVEAATKVQAMARGKKGRLG